MENSLVKQEQITHKLNFFDPTSFETAQRVCRFFAKSELVPPMYKESPDNPIEKAMSNCLVAMELASRIDASPLMIMQNMAIIHGRPSWSSKFLIATVNTCGRFNPLQFRFENNGFLGKIEYVEYEKVWDKTLYAGKGGYRNSPKKIVFDGTQVPNTTCIAYTTEKGSDKVLESSPISIKMAIEEGWYTKAGSKWVTMPQQMLMYRAASFWTNVYAPELSMGMKTVEEIRDMDIMESDYEDISMAKPTPPQPEIPTIKIEPDNDEIPPIGVPEEVIPTQETPQPEPQPEPQKKVAPKQSGKAPF